MRRFGWNMEKFTAFSGEVLVVLKNSCQRVVVFFFKDPTEQKKICRNPKILSKETTRLEGSRKFPAFPDVEV